MQTMKTNVEENNNTVYKHSICLRTYGILSSRMRRPITRAHERMLSGEIMIKQWWAQQAEGLGHWIYRKRLAAMQRRIQKQKALLNGSAKLTTDEMHTLRNEILRDVQGHATPDHSMHSTVK
jgi:hypothetical protein